MLVGLFCYLPKPIIHKNNQPKVDSHNISEINNLYFSLITKKLETNKIDLLIFLISFKYLRILFYKKKNLVNQYNLNVIGQTFAL